MATKKLTKKTTAKTITPKNMRVSKITKKVASVKMKKEMFSEPIDQEMLATRKASFIPSFLKSKIIIGILAIALLIYLFKGLFIAAIVNGQPVSRLAILKQLEKAHGKEVLDNMVIQTLIMQEAQKRHISISDADINAEVKKVEDNVKKQGQDINQLLAAQGMTQKDLADQIRLQKLVGKMVAQNVTVTDKEITDYIDKNKDTLPQDQDEQKIKDQVKTQLQQQKMQQAEQAFVQSLQSKAQVKYFVSY